MLNLTQIIESYPSSLKGFTRNLLREYLQYKILDLIFSSSHSSKMVFMGGTSLRIVHNNNRFSEDLDFDNFGLSQQEFEEISKAIKRGLELEGLEVEMQNVYKGAYHCKIRLPKILTENNLSVMHTEKLLILIDTAPQNFDFKPETITLNKFDVLTLINSTTLDILFSQKIYASLNRKRAKGRDFFDMLFLMSQKVKPNYDYLEAKIQITNPTDLKKKILEECQKLDFKQLYQDVRPFLFNPNDQKLLHFVSLVEGYEF